MGSAVNVISSSPRKNYVINGSFDFFQRKGAVPSWVDQGNLYTADRWFRFKQTGGGAGVWTNIQDAGLGYGRRSLKIGRTSGSSDVNSTEIIQALESKDSVELSGKKVTFSFKVRKGANFSGSQVAFYIGYGTGTDQGVVSAWTGAGIINGISIPASELSTSTYYQASLTTTLPTLNQLRFDINYIPTGTAGANDWIEICEVMLSEGDLTQFVRAGLTFEGELLLCQRYYEKSYNLYVAPGAVALEGCIIASFINASSQLRMSAEYKVKKRVSSHVFTCYSPQTGLANRVRDTNGGIDRVQIADTSGEDGSNISADGATANQTGQAHWVAEAEL